MTKQAAVTANSKRADYVAPERPQREVTVAAVSCIHQSTYQADDNLTPEQPDDNNHLIRVAAADRQKPRSHLQEDDGGGSQPRDGTCK